MPQLRCYVGVPILLEGKVIGFLNVKSTKAGIYAENHMRQLQAFANHAALALRNARNYQQGKQIATLEERQRIARDLHDAVNQSLFSASVMSATLGQVYKKAPERLPPHCLRICII